MPTEKEVILIQKATMYDLKRILEQEPDKTYTVEELKQLIDSYIRVQSNKPQPCGLETNVSEPNRLPFEF